MEKRPSRLQDLRHLLLRRLSVYAHVVRSRHGLGGAAQAAVAAMGTAESVDRAAEVAMDARREAACIIAMLAIFGYTLQRKHTVALSVTGSADTLVSRYAASHFRLAEISSISRPRTIYS